MLEGSLFLLEGVSEGVCLRTGERGVKGSSSEELGDPFFVLEPS